MIEKTFLFFDRAAWLLLLYFFGLVLLFGIKNRDVVDAMVAIFILYAPVLALFYIYIVIIFIAEIRRKFQHESINYKRLALISLKVGSATIPMYFFDNRLANLLVFLR